MNVVHVQSPDQSQNLRIYTKIRPSSPDSQRCRAVVEGELCTTVKFYLLRFWKHFEIGTKDTALEIVEEILMYEMSNFLPIHNLKSADFLL